MHQLIESCVVSSAANGHTEIEVVAGCWLESPGEKEWDPFCLPARIGRQSSLVWNRSVE